MGWVERQPNVLATAALVIALNTTFVALRIAFRKTGKGSILWWDDWFAIIAWALNVAQCSVVIWWVYLGLGKHIEDVKTPLSEQLKTIFIFELLYAWALYFVKISALCFYGRMFRILRHFRVQLWLTGALVTAWIITVTFLSVFSCVPVQKSWYTDTPGSCLDLYAAYITNGVMSFVTDIIIVLLPLPVLWRLDMDVKKRICTILIFIASYATCAVSILRTVFVITQSPGYAKDFSCKLSLWERISIDCALTLLLVVFLANTVLDNPVAGVILAVLEPGWGLICICLPSILGLVNQSFRRYSQWVSSRRSKKSTETMLRPVSSTRKVTTSFAETESF